MRRLAPLICLLFFAAVAFSGQGDAQNKTTSKASRARRAKPAPTPKPTDDFFADIPDAKLTPKPAAENILDLLPDEEPEPPSEWKLILFQDESAYSYNTRRITHPNQGVVKVWIKWKLYGNKRKKYISEMSESPYDYSKYFYSLQLEEYDCKGFRQRLLKVIDYTLFDDLIYSTAVKNDWKDVVPESVGERILESVCSHKE